MKLLFAKIKGFPSSASGKVRSWVLVLWDSLILQATLAVVVVVLLLIFIPKWQAMDYTPARDRAPTRLEIENKLRGTLAQILAGVLVLAGLYIGWRRVMVAQEGQITERFTRAVDQLGSDKLEIRLGGIYALERIAKDSADKDHWTIMEILTAFVRERSHLPDDSHKHKENIKPRLQDGEKAEPSLGKESLQADAPEKQHGRKDPGPPTDIQAVMTVLGRRNTLFIKGQDQPLNLRRANLRKINLRKAHLEETDLLEAHLEGADLLFAHLERAFLIGAFLEHAHLEGAHLEGTCLQRVTLNGASLHTAHLEGASLQEAFLYGAHLDRANLSGTNMERAILIEAHLVGACLVKANLEGAVFSYTHLEGADLSGATGLTKDQINQAIINEETILPEGLK